MPVGISPVNTEITFIKPNTEAGHAGITVGKLVTEAVQARIGAVQTKTKGR